MVLSGFGSVEGEATGAIDVALTGADAVCAMAGATPPSARHPAAAAVENRRKFRNLSGTFMLKSLVERHRRVAGSNVMFHPPDVTT